MDGCFSDAAVYLYDLDAERLLGVYSIVAGDVTLLLPLWRIAGQGIDADYVSTVYQGNRILCEIRHSVELAKQWNSAK